MTMPKRPLIITLIVIFVVLSAGYSLVLVFLAFSSGFSVLTILNGIIEFIALVSAYALWNMKKWGVILYTISVFAIDVVSFLPLYVFNQGAGSVVTGAIVPYMYYTFAIIGYVLPILTVIILFTKYEQMG